MAKYTPYALNTLPQNNIDVNGIYFIKAGTNRFNVYIRNNANSQWFELGVVNGVNTVNNLSGNVSLGLSISSSGILSITGSSETVDLDERYRKNIDPIPWASIINSPDFALDNTVVHKTGAESIAGVKSFSSSPKVPYAQVAEDAINRGQVYAEIQNIYTALGALETTLSTGLKYKGGINASGNPPYPDGDVGDVWIISDAGKIGGDAGIEMSIGNMIVCKEQTLGGLQQDVGGYWTLIQSDLDQATENKAGFAKIATKTDVEEGFNDENIITPLKLRGAIKDEAVRNSERYVMYAQEQELSFNDQTTALKNIDAARASTVVNLTEDQQVAGFKTFTSPVKVPPAQNDNQAVNKGQMDAGLSAKANSNTVVKLTGYQTIGGVKTFTSVPVLPPANPIAANQAAHKKYVDEAVGTQVAWGGVGKEW